MENETLFRRAFELISTHQDRSPAEEKWLQDAQPVYEAISNEMTSVELEQEKQHA